MTIPAQNRSLRHAERKPRLRVGFILARRFTLCAFADVVDVLRLAADEGDRSRPILCRWNVVSDSMGPVASSCGVRVQPDARPADPRDFDDMVVVGGLIDEVDTLDLGTVRFLRAAADAGVPLVGVRTGAFALHRAGLMDGHRCCVSWFHHADVLAQFEGPVPVSDRICVVDRDRLTCSGGASSAHLAAHPVERHVGEAAAHKSLQIMIIEGALAGEKAQPGVPLRVTTTDDGTKRALLQMRQHVEDPLPIEEVAHRVGLSRRSLERHFDRALGRSPSECYLSIRLDQADMLLRTTDRTVAAVAAATGFCDTSHLTRVFRKHRGGTPGRNETVHLRAVGHGEVEPERAHDGADQPFGLAWSEPEHRPQGQGRQDGQAGIDRMPAAGRPGLAPPARDRLRGEPDRRAPAPAQVDVILTPVCDFEPWPGDAVATVGIGFERHRGPTDASDGHRGAT